MTVNGTSIVKAMKNNINDNNQEENTAIGKYYGNDEVKFKFIDSENVYAYQQNNNIWYYSQMTVQDALLSTLIDKTDLDFVSSCNNAELNLDDIGDNLIYKADSKYFSYFDSNYTEFYSLVDDNSKVLYTLITDQSLISELSSAIFSE